MIARAIFYSVTFGRFLDNLNHQIQKVGPPNSSFMRQGRTQGICKVLQNNSFYESEFDESDYSFKFEYTFYNFKILNSQTLQ